jgi:glucose uptake protein
MILPQSYPAVLFVMVLSLLCLGSWASLFKLAGKWRFELFYVDFAIGLFLAAVILSFTMGNIGFDGFNFLDDLQHAGKRQWMYVFVAGLIFNLGNMLLMAAVSVSALAVAFPMGMGMALLVGTLLGISSRPAGNGMLLGMGCLLILTSIIVSAASYRIMGVAQHEALARAGKAKSTRRPSPWKGIVLALAAGLLIGAFTPLVEKARQGDIGLGPYALGFLFACGVFLSSFVFDIFFMNLPVEGAPVEFGWYLQGGLKQHLSGLISGMIWYIGILSAWVWTSVPEAIQGDAVPRFLLAQASPVLAALWGIVIFREFKESDVRVKVMGTLMLVLFLCGLCMISLAPLLLGKGAPPS